MDQERHQVHESLEKAKHEMAVKLGELNRRAHHIRQQLSLAQHAQKRPWTVVGVALVTGFVASRLFRSHRDRRLLSALVETAWLKWTERLNAADDLFYLNASETANSIHHDACEAIADVRKAAAELHASVDEVIAQGQQEQSVPSLFRIKPLTLAAQASLFGLARALLEKILWDRMMNYLDRTKEQEQPQARHALGEGKTVSVH